jgi:hypothetical protein
VYASAVSGMSEEDRSEFDAGLLEPWDWSYVYPVMLRLMFMGRQAAVDEPRRSSRRLLEVQMLGAEVTLVDV